MTAETEFLYWVWLSELFSRGSAKPRALLEKFQTPENIFDASEKELLSLGLLQTAEITRITRRSLERSEYIVKECKRLKIQIVPMNSPLYPNRLKNIYGPPTVLYVYGDLTGIDENVALGVVGTRKPSDYGMMVTDELCYRLTAAGAMIVSGCAVGIDAHAHLGALKAGGRTFAVLGCGPDIDYPAENKGLKREILRHGGALISELPPGTAVSGTYFPTRNRLIAGLSLGVLVTEAPARSGSLITLNHALDQGKDVFCVPPHDIHDSMFRGVVKPLRDGAIPVYEAEDILLEYYGQYSHKLSADKAVGEYIRQVREQEDRPVRKVADESRINGDTTKRKPDPQTEDQISRPEPELSGAKKTVYDALSHTPQYVNELVQKIGLSMPELLSTLTELEIEGIVVSYSGQRYGKI